MEKSSLTIKSTCLNDKALGDKEIISNFLEKACDHLNLVPIMPPHVFSYSGAVKEDKGISGFILFEEGNIEVHTFPLRKQLFLELSGTSISVTEKQLEVILGILMHIFNISEYEYEIKSPNKSCRCRFSVS